MPNVVETVGGVIGQEPSKGFNPDEVVATGCQPVEFGYRDSVESLQVDQPEYEDSDEEELGVLPLLMTNGH